MLSHIAQTGKGQSSTEPLHLSSHIHLGAQIKLPGGRLLGNQTGFQGNQVLTWDPEINSLARLRK